MVGEPVRLPFIMPGSRELADAVVEAVRRGPAVLLCNHGLLVAAADLERAVEVTEIVEQTADSLVACRLLRKRPKVLPRDTVATLREMTGKVG